MGDLRRSAWLIAAAALVPLLLFFVLQSAFSAREEQQSTERDALAMTRTVIAAADGEVSRNIEAFDELATARSLRRSDLAEFRSRALELIVLNPGWRGAELRDAASSAPLVRVGQTPAVATAAGASLPTSRARFDGLVRAPSCACLSFVRLAVGPPGRTWTLRLFVDQSSFQALLPPPRGKYEVTALVDGDGRFIARSIKPAERFATLGSTYLRKAATSGAATGTYRGFTLEGFENYTSFARSPLTGWSAHAAQARQNVDNPAWRFLASLGVAALLSAMLAAVLIAFALRQIAEGRRIAERMQQAQKLEALGQLTGGLAHDFNNLLTPVIGALDFVGRKPGIDASSKRLLAGALASARRAGKLTAQLLAFSRRQKLLIAPIEIAAMLDEMDDLLRQSLGESHVLKLAQDDRELCALSDLNQLELAILNLLLNARDASPDGSVIALTVIGSGTAERGDVVICVRDEGLGMDEATRQRAIEPFFTTKPVGRGTGLGLAQVFGMAEQSGGQLAIDSAPGAGTTVTLTLRRCAAAPNGPAAAIRAALPELERSLRLLVVDDEPLVRAAIVHPLEEAGHIVDAVSDGATALAAIEARRFDLALVDFAMPGMNGAELIRRALAVRPEQRFLIVTGYADSALLAATTPVLKKPFATADLLAIVEETAAVR